MKECKNCIHYDCCAEYTTKEMLDSFPQEQPCEFFKDSGNVVEIVRCKDCKHIRKDNEADGIFVCLLHRNMYHGEDFCSYGEKRAEQ